MHSAFVLHGIAQWAKYLRCVLECSRYSRCCAVIASSESHAFGPEQVAPDISKTRERRQDRGGIVDHCVLIDTVYYAKENHLLLCEETIRLCYGAQSKNFRLRKYDRSSNSRRRALIRRRKAIEVKNELSCSSIAFHFLHPFP